MILVFIIIVNYTSRYILGVNSNQFTVASQYTSHHRIAVFYIQFPLQLPQRCVRFPLSMRLQTRLPECLSQWRGGRGVRFWRVYAYCLSTHPFPISDKASSTSSSSTDSRLLTTVSDLQKGFSLMTTFRTALTNLRRLGEAPETGS